MRRRGTIAQWNDRRGFGFIEPEGKGERIFLHISQIATPERRPFVGDVVEFEREPGRKRGPRAVEVVFLSPARPARLWSRIDGPAVLLAVAAIAFVSVMTVRHELPTLVLIAYALASIVSFVIYACDKAAATRGGWRTPERTLHLLALFGGWPGALVAQSALRHKTRKESFRFAFWLTVVVNVAFVAGLWYGGA